MKTLTAGNVPKKESSKSPKLMPVTCSKLRLYELFKNGSTCSAGAMKGALPAAGVGASVASELPPAGKLTPRSILPEGFSPITELHNWSNSKDWEILFYRRGCACSETH